MRADRRFLPHQFQIVLCQCFKVLVVVMGELQGIMVRKVHIQDTVLGVQDIGLVVQDIGLVVQDIDWVFQDINMMRQDISVTVQDIVLYASRYYDMPFKMVVSHHYISVAALLP